jgi:hypothetical protein
LQCLIDLPIDSLNIIDSQLQFFSSLAVVADLVVISLDDFLQLLDLLLLFSQCGGLLLAAGVVL